MDRKKNNKLEQKKKQSFNNRIDLIEDVVNEWLVMEMRNVVEIVSQKTSTFVKQLMSNQLIVFIVSKHR